MIEQYIYDRITADPTLQGLLSDGNGGYLLYPNVVPREGTIEKAITFTTIATIDVYPAAESVNVQFNIFSKTHTEAAQITQALADIFNEDNNQTAGGIQVVYSQRKSQSDLGKDRDDDLYQREATYYFKLR